MKNIRIIGIIAVVFIIIITAVFAIFAAIGILKADKPQEDSEIIIENADEKMDPSLWQISETAGDIKAVIKTEKGDIEIKLFDCAAAEKFIELDNSGSFNGAAFEITAGDMFIQTGLCGEGFSPEETGLSPIKGAFGFVLDEKTAYPSLIIITGEELSDEYEESVLVFGAVVSGTETALEIAFGENAGYAGGYAAAEPVKISNIEIIYPTETNNND